MAHNIFKMYFASIYELYLAKIERKGRIKPELDQVICWLTGHNADSLKEKLDKDITVEEFFSTFPSLNKNAHLITGTICGYKVEEIQDPLMKKIRFLDKLVDELAKGKSMDKILRE